MMETVRAPIPPVPPPARSLTPLVEASPCFNETELAQIIAEGLALPLAKGQVTAIERAPKARNSTVALFPSEPRHSWMVERIARVVNLVNRQHWGFELAGSERLQFSAYGPGEHYDWHIDLGAQHHFAQRKISISIQLNDPSIFRTRSGSRTRLLCMAIPSGWNDEIVSHRDRFGDLNLYIKTGERTQKKRHLKRLGRFRGLYIKNGQFP